MKNTNQAFLPLADISSPEVKAIAQKLFNPEAGEFDNFERIFYYVRDSIPFGFPPVWDEVKASETIRYGMGYCNTKSIVMQALCTLNQIPVRLRVGQIQTKIMKNVFPSWAFPFIDTTTTHMWIEAKLGGRWTPIDAYILDYEFYLGAKDLLKNSDLRNGYGLGDIDFYENGDWHEGFVQTNALEEDNGIWEDAVEFYNSVQYRPFSAIQESVYPLLKNIANRNIDQIRNHGKELVRAKALKEELGILI